MRVSRRLRVWSLLALLAVSGSALSPGDALARLQGERSAGAEFGLGLGAFLCTIPWGLLKTGYALLGGVTGGLGFALTGGRSDISRAIWQASLRGDFVVTPENLTGQRPISFVGRDPQQDAYPYPE